MQTSTAANAIASEAKILQQERSVRNGVLIILLLCVAIAWLTFVGW